jgi:hypothetical protein
VVAPLGDELALTRLGNLKARVTIHCLAANPSRAQPLAWLGIAAFTALAGTGILVMLSTGDALPHSLLRLIDPWELSKVWNLDQGLLHGGSAHELYGRRGADGYMLPFQLLFLPLGLLPATGVALVGRVAYGVLIIAALRLWGGGSRPARIALIPVLMSVPVAQGLMADHLLSASGFAALSLALWAQRRDRWWLCGIALGLGLIRPANAVPVVAMILVGAWGRPGPLLRSIAAGAATLVPLVIIAFLLDPQWIQDYRSNVAQYPIAGLAQVVLVSWGTPGLIALQAITGGAAAWLVRRSAGGPLDIDTSAAGLALSTLSAPMEGLYTGVFILPALLRVGARDAYRVAPWLASGIAWVVVVASAPVLTSPGWLALWGVLTALNLWLLVNCYPLLLGRAGARTTAARPADPYLP